MDLREKIVNFQYHLNCQYIHDNTGAIEISFVERSPNSYYAYFYLKSHHANVNRQDLKLCWIEVRKRLYIFNITSIVRIFLTKQVILNLVWWKEVRTLKMRIFT